MQYNININQKQLIELSSYLGIKINLKTASILDFFKKAHTVFNKKIIKNDVYYKVEYEKVLEQNPLLGIEKKQVARHFDKLVEMSILKKQIVKGKGTETYFAPDFNYIKCFFEFKTQDKNVLSTGQKSSVPQDKNVLSYIEHKNNNIELVNIESTQKIQDFKNNPNYSRWRAIDFPDLTDEQLELAIETYLSDYPKAKTTSIVGYLTDYNKKHKKPGWVKAKEKEVVYQENVEKAKKDSGSDSQAYGNLLSMDEASQEPQREEIDPRLGELTKEVRKRLQNGVIKLSDYPVLNPSLFKSVMKTPIDQQVAFFVAIEKQALTKAKN